MKAVNLETHLKVLEENLQLKEQMKSNHKTFENDQFHV